MKNKWKDTGDDILGYFLIVFLLAVFGISIYLFGCGAWYQPKWFLMDVMAGLMIIVVYQLGDG